LLADLATVPLLVIDDLGMRKLRTPRLKISSS
jgi:DNA replication protein DnaC